MTVFICTSWVDLLSCVVAHVSFLVMHARERVPVLLIQ